MRERRDDVAQRLREEHQFRFGFHEDGGEAPSLYTNAADLIESQAAENDRLRALLRRALRSHDAIVAAYRVGGRRTPGKAIDDMHAVKALAVEMECYPAPSSVLRAADFGSSVASK